MLEAPERAAGVDEDPDRVEANRAGARAVCPLLAKPRGGEAPQALPLARPKARQGILSSAVARLPPAHATRLHLDEHERPSVEGDQVDLAPTCANVAREHREAQALEVPGGDLLAKAAERAPAVGIAGAPAWQRGEAGGSQGEPRYRLPGRVPAARSGGASRSKRLGGEGVCQGIGVEGHRGPPDSRSLLPVQGTPARSGAGKNTSPPAATEDGRAGNVSGGGRGPGAVDGVTAFMGLRWESPETVRLEVRPDLINEGGLLSGVVTYALVDYCMGSTLWAHTSEEESIATVSISINYIQTATEGELVCRTVLDRRNRTTAVLRSEVQHEDGRLLVTAIGSYAIFPARRPDPDAARTRAGGG